MAKKSNIDQTQKKSFQESLRTLKNNSGLTLEDFCLRLSALSGYSIKPARLTNWFAGFIPRLKGLTAEESMALIISISKEIVGEALLENSAETLNSYVTTNCFVKTVADWLAKGVTEKQICLITQTPFSTFRTWQTGKHLCPVTRFHRMKELMSHWVELLSIQNQLRLKIIELQKELKEKQQLLQ